MDSAGFLIMHEDFLAHSEKAQDLEYVHITNKEKNIAEHLITNGYLKKRECRNLKEIQKQSFYEVDLPDGGVDVLKSGDSCSKYQLNKIVGTNAYRGLSMTFTCTHIVVAGEPQNFAKDNQSTSNVRLLLTLLKL